MECSDICLTREAIENSSHPELEAPCTLVYIYMTDLEKDVDSHRAKVHAVEHRLIAIRRRKNA